MTTTASKLRPFTLITTLSLFGACSSEQDQGAGGPSVSQTTGVTTTGPGAGGTSTTTTTTGSSTATSTTGAGSSVSSSQPTTSAPGAGPGNTSGAGPATGGTSEETGSGNGGTSGAGSEQAGGPSSEVANTETAEPGASGETSASAGTSSGEGSDAPSPLPPTDDYSDFGPFETTSQANTGPDGTYTIVRPQTLGTDGFLHAPITFGPGTGMQVSQMMGLLERIASHGFVIIGRQLEGGPGDPLTRMRMIGGLDWIIAQNTTAGSVFEGKLDVEHAVAMGYSVGGTGAVEIGGHEAIATVVSIHGHGAEGELRGPLLLMGGTDDVMGSGESWLTPTYEASQTATFFSLVVGADHGYIQGTHAGVPGGVETPAMIAWLRYWIYNDQVAQRYFEGDDCVMCDAPWANPQRKNWP
jgi:hypothetical protein